MKINLVKRPDVVFGKKFYRDWSDNNTKIENTINENDNYMSKHQTTQLKAHQSQQIAHGQDTVFDKVNRIQAEVSNLALANNGDGIAEVTQSRVAMDSSAHSTVAERLAYDFLQMYSGIEKINDTITNIKFYGAVGDGVTDDTAAIQALLDRDNAYLYVPNGIYNITSNLRLRDNPTIMFESKDAIFKRMSDDCNYMFINGGEGDNFSAYNGNGNIKMVGGTLDLNSNVYKTVNSAFMLRHSSSNLFKDMDVLDVANGHAWDMNGCLDNIFDNCRALGWRDLTANKSLVAQEAWQLSVAGKDIFEWSAQDGTTNRRIRFRNCYTGNSGTEGSVAYNVAVGNHSAYTTPNAEYVYFDDCHFEGGNYYALRLLGFRHVWTNNCKVNDFVGLVALHASTGLVWTPTGEQTDKSDSVAYGIHLKNVDFYVKDNSTNREAILLQGSTTSNGALVNYCSKASFDNVRMNGVKARTTRLMRMDNCYQVDIAGIVAYDFASGIRGDNNQFVNINTPQMQFITGEAIYFTNTKFSDIVAAYIINCAIDSSNGAVSFEDGCSNNTVRVSAIRLGGLGRQRFGVYMDDQAFYCLSIDNYLEGTVGKSLTPSYNCFDGTILSEGNKSYVLQVKSGQLAISELRP